jgi:hypothetical protein
MAIDARLVKSSARPKSTEKIEEEKLKRETAGGQVDKKGRPWVSKALEHDTNFFQVARNRVSR